MLSFDDKLTIIIKVLFCFVNRNKLRIKIDIVDQYELPSFNLGYSIYLSKLLIVHFLFFFFRDKFQTSSS